MAIHPEKFATGDFDLWLASFERCATANGWGETQKLHKLPAYLTGTAQDYFALLSAPDKETYESLLSSLRRVLIPTVYREYYYKQFHARSYSPDEDPRLYVSALKNLLYKADSELDAAARDTLVLRQFLSCLPTDLKFALLATNATPTLPDVIDFILHRRAIHQLSDRVSKATSLASKELSLSRTVADLRISVANLSKDQEVLRDSITAMSTPSSPASCDRRCGNCNARAHTCFSCPWPTMCSNCLTWDHLQHACPRTHFHGGDIYSNSSCNFQGGPDPLRAAPVDADKDECPHIFAFKNVNECGAPLSSSSQQPLVLCKVNGVLVRALIDTGSMKSFISSRVYAGFRPRPHIDVFAGNSCVSITGQPLRVDGVVQASLQLSCGEGVSYTGSFLVCSNLLPPLECILGWDFLTSNELSILGHGSSYFLRGSHGSAPLTPCTSLSEECPTSLSPAVERGACPIMLTQSPSRGPVPVTLSDNVLIPSRVELILPCSVPQSVFGLVGMITPKPSANLPPSLQVAYTISNAGPGGKGIPVRIMNASNTDIEMFSGQKIADFCPMVESIQCPFPEVNYVGSTARYPSVQGEITAALSDSLSIGDRKILLETLMQYTDVFQPDLGETDVITHRINTGTSPPIRQHPRRLPYAYREETRKQITEMLDQGVITPSHSPWASPIVLVRKKDGSFRFCIDYRRLNSVTIRDAHPLPRVDDLLEALNGSTIFSTLDLRQGYWQIRMHPDDREKTAFATPDGLYEFVRLPFGLSGAPATFDRALEIILSGLQYDICLCYFDDIIIPSRTITEHCQKLSLVLDRFRTHNLRVKASKCCFGAKTVRYLGHVVSAEGVHTDPAKIESVKRIVTPQNVAQVRSFLGLAGYYRKFIHNFATLTYPLVELTKKGRPFCWTEVHDIAFSTLKSGLCSSPVLAFPVLDRQFVLQTDASDVGLGAILTQFDRNGHERVVSYASRTLSDSEKNYSATEKELLAVVFAVEYFRVYLLGRKFLLFTDHNALRWLHSAEPKGRRARWIMDLQEYEFEVQHRPGAQNSNADALSRLPQENPINTVLPSEINHGPVLSAAMACLTMLAPEKDLQQAQLEDPSISKVIELKNLGFPKPPYFVWAKNKYLSAFWNCWDSLFLVDGILVKSPPNPRNLPDYAVVVPEKLVHQVMSGLHNSSFGGHLGISKTISRAKGRFYWPQMRRRIRTFVQSCRVCGEIKISTNTTKAPLRPINVSEPFVFWAMDYMGPLPETSRGNKHVLVVMDHFTKWCEAFPTQDQKARTVASILVSKIFSRFGPPVAIHSDQGSNFESNLIHEVCDIMGIHKSRTTAYHPQGDGLVERQNRTLQDILSSFVSEHKDDWDLWIDIAVYAYNTSPQESTGFSPFELVFGHPARLPIEHTLGVPLKNPSLQSEYARDLRKALSSVKGAAEEHLSKARRLQQAQYASQSRREWVPFVAGQWVWLRRPKHWKFGKRWRGPYKVLVQRGVNYQVKDKAGKTLNVHHNQLKLCTVPQDGARPTCPVPETGEIEIVYGHPGGDGNPGCANHEVHNPLKICASTQLTTKHQASHALWRFC